MIVAFRRHTLLPLDDCLYALQPSIPHLTRSSLHRCLQRHGISRLPDMEGDKPKRQKFKRYPIGYFHIDIAELRTNEGKLYLFVAIDRTSKFAVALLVDKANRKTAWEFLETVLEAVPYKIHTILTDNGIQFCEQPRNRNTPYSRPMRFDMICAANEIEHRLTKPNHPWTNGQVERMNRTIKDATVKRYHYDSHDQLRSHLSDFLNAYNYARRLKTLSGLTPYEYICKIWTSEPDRFILNPIHQMPWKGDIWAFYVSAAYAAALTAVRSVKATSMVAAIPFAYIGAALFIGPFVSPIEAFEIQWPLFLGHGAFIGAASCLLALGPRYIGSTEVSLLILLESVLAPILVWVVIGENPGFWALVGGAIVVGSLLFSNLYLLAKQKSL